MRYERDANEFAAVLLMPEELIRSESIKMKIDLANEDGLSHLAKKFDVSSAAMYWRLANLDLL
jgi:Zn-dependent peptidase ImmA (M78 family)